MTYAYYHTHMCMCNVYTCILIYVHICILIHTHIHTHFFPSPPSCPIACSHLSVTNSPNAKDHRPQQEILSPRLFVYNKVKG